MKLRQIALAGLLALGACVAAVVPAGAQKGAETFTATAAVKATGASAPVTIIVERKMPQAEVDRFLAAFKAGGPTALRKRLVGVPPTGSVQLGNGQPIPTRLTMERPAIKGRFLTIVTDQPIHFLGGNAPGAPPKEGYDFAIIDLELDPTGAGSGTLAPAAKVTMKQDVFVVDDYGSEVVYLTGVKKVK